MGYYDGKGYYRSDGEGGYDGKGYYQSEGWSSNSSVGDGGGSK